MTTIQVSVPDYLAKTASEVAKKEKISIDQIVSMALSSQVSAWNVRDDVGTRAKRADMNAFGRIMDKVKDRTPLPGDEI